MNKTELIQFMAEQADLTRAAAGRALDALTKGVATALKAGEQVVLVNFGTFSASKRAERTGRNPQTGEAITIKASNVVRFKPGKELKDEVNK